MRGTLAEVYAHFVAHAARGEITIIVQGIGGDSDDEVPAEAVPAEPPTVPEALQAALASGLSERDAVRQVSADLKLSRRDVYAEMLVLKGNT